MTDKVQSNMYLENRIQERNIILLKRINKNKTSEVMLANINQEVRRKRSKKIGLEPTPATLCRCAGEEACEKTTRRSMWNLWELVMQKRAYGGCLGTKSR